MNISSIELGNLVDGVTKPQAATRIGPHGDSGSSGEIGKIVPLRPLSFVEAEYTILRNRDPEPSGMIARDCLNTPFQLGVDQWGQRNWFKAAVDIVEQTGIFAEPKGTVGVAPGAGDVACASLDHRQRIVEVAHERLPEIAGPDASILSRKQSEVLPATSVREGAGYNVRRAETIEATPGCDPDVSLAIFKGIGDAIVAEILRLTITIDDVVAG